MKIEQPGSYQISSAAYHADPAPEPSLSNSIARLLLDCSPLHAWWAHPRLNPDWQPDEGSNRLALGTAAHLLVLGRGAQLAVGEWDDWRSKDARQFRDDAIARGETPIKRPDYERAQAIAEAAHAQAPELGDPEHGFAELAHVAQDPSGAWLRCPTDWISRDGLEVTDYKTTQGSASPLVLPRTVASLGYDLQAAFYDHVLGCLYPDRAGRMRFVFAFQEIEPPYQMCRVTLSEGDLEVARRKVRTAIDMWNECLRTGKWPGYPQHVVPIQLPPWSQSAWLEREMADGA